MVLTELVECDRLQTIVARNTARGRVLASGTFLSETFASGICVQGGDSEEMTDAQVVATVPPCVSMTVVLNGEVRFGYDSEEYLLRSPHQSQQNGYRAIAVNLRRLTTFRRQIRRGERALRKVHIRVRPEWFERGSGHSEALRRLNARLLRQHLAKVYWHPSPHVLALCERILALREESDDLLRSLRVETLANQVLGHFIDEVLTQGDDAPADASRPPPCRVEPLAAAMAFLEAHLHSDIRLEDVARASAMSVSALQRRFKKDTGITVFDYVRNRRLEKVRDALCKDNLSIGEAAYMAGYNHTSNFITAFKRKFGVTPGKMNDNNSRSL